MSTPKHSVTFTGRTDDARVAGLILRAGGKTVRLPLGEKTEVTEAQAKRAEKLRDTHHLTITGLGQSGSSSTPDAPDKS